jgi:hypothetical protein
MTIHYTGEVQLAKRYQDREQALRERTAQENAIFAAHLDGYLLSEQVK